MIFLSTNIKHKIVDCDILWLRSGTVFVDERAKIIFILKYTVHYDHSMSTYTMGWRGRKMLTVPVVHYRTNNQGQF